jgi:hypothetical protein
MFKQNKQDNVEVDEELNRLLERAGIKKEIKKQFSKKDVGHGKKCDCAECRKKRKLEEQSEFDYGDEPTSRKGFRYDFNPYGYEGTAQMPQRITDARFGDNPLAAYDYKSFHEYFAESVQHINELTKVENLYGLNKGKVLRWLNNHSGLHSIDDIQRALAKEGINISTVEIGRALSDRLSVYMTRKNGEEFYSAKA